MMLTSLSFTLLASLAFAAAFDSIPPGKCADICYKTAEYGEEIATLQCEKRPSCEVRQCSTTIGSISGYRCGKKTPTSTTTISVQMVSAGFQDGNKADIIVNGLSVFKSDVPVRPTSARRGLNVATVDQNTGKFLRYANFDTYASENENRGFQEFIREQSRGRIILIAVKDEGSNKFEGESRWLCEGLGSTQARNLAIRSSWAMIGRVGGAPGSALETIRKVGGGSSTLNVARFPLKVPFNSKRFEIRVVSAGYEDGNFADMQINGLSIRKSGLRNVHSAGGRGLHVAVVDHRSGKFLSYAEFDFHGSSSAAASFSEYIKSISHGRIVLIAVRDEASRLMNTSTRNLIRGLGSSEVDRLGTRDSWCMIGRVGATKGTAVEALSKRTKGPAKTHASIAAV